MRVIMMSDMHTHACPFPDNSAVATRVTNSLDLLAAEHISASPKCESHGITGFSLMSDG